MPAKKKYPSPVLPSGTFFYAIPLKKGKLELTRAMLEEHYPHYKGRKLYYGNEVQYTGFSRGIATVSVKLKAGKVYMLYLHAEPETLYVACNCGMNDEKLCLHAYLGLYHLTWSHILDLSAMYWPGFDRNEKLQARYLNVELRKSELIVKARPQFGHLFRPAVGINNMPLCLDGKPALVEPHPLQGNRTVVAFCAVYGTGTHGKTQLPVLIACVAQTTVDNLSLNLFKEITGISEADSLPALTSNQLFLLELASEMRKLKSELDEYGCNSNLPEYRGLKAAMLTFLEKALPLLALEPNTYTFTPYKVVHKNGKIAGLSKSFIQPCRFSITRPALYFVLKHHKDYFSLTAAVSVSGVPLNVSHRTSLFVIEKETGCHYLIPSIEADDLLCWMQRHHNRVTILNEHIAEFEDAFLAGMSKSIPVYVDCAGKLKPYIEQASQEFQ